MEKKKLYTSIDSYEKVNDNFAKVKIHIAYANENRNGTYISKEAFEKSAHTLKYAPIVGYYLKGENQFDGHSERIVIEGDNYEVETLTVPYGVVIGEAENGKDAFWWEDVVEESGNVKSYFTCYGYLWIGRYEELKSIRERDYSQSMEILVNNGHWDEETGIYHINDFDFSALCILEKQEPCFESSTISLAFSKKEYEVEYKTMINELKAFTLETLEEGGSEELPNDDKLKEDFEEVEATDVEETEVVDNPTDVEVGVEEVEVEATEDIKDETEEVDEPIEEESEEGEEEKEDFEVKYNETLAELNELKAKYVDLEANFESLNGEVSELREFKTNIEKQEKDTELNEIFGEYEVLNKFSEYNELFEKRYELDKEEIIKSLKVIAFDNGVNIKKAKKDFSKNTIKVPVVGSVDLSTNSDWDILERHIKK